MSAEFHNEELAWRKCEVAWSAWLQAREWAVFPYTEAEGNIPGVAAPMAQVGGGIARSPDFIAMKNGRTEIWEVKFRTRSDFNQLTGTREHWISNASFRDYYRIAVAAGSPFFIILYERATALTPGRWLKIEIERIFANGKVTTKYGQDGEQIEAWAWPVSAMEVVQGPSVAISPQTVTLLPVESENPALDVESFVPLERDLRSLDGTRAEVAKINESREMKIMKSDAQVGLDVLSHRLGLPQVPKYSVVRIGNKGSNNDDVLGFAKYGIRTFFVTANKNSSLAQQEVQAFEDARIIEWSVQPDVEGEDIWVIDGQFPTDEKENARVSAFLEKADDAGDINLRQFIIVHAPHDADIVVEAGAGTGKTETMSERVMFLLATSREVQEIDGREVLTDMRLDEIVLVTFTREASREMRARIALTLNLRLRVCSLCVLPAMAWLMQLSNTEINTIHSYAKTVARSGGGTLGISPGFRVAKQTMLFRELLLDSLSENLVELFENYPDKEVPPVHKWRNHIEEVWNSLDNNGLDVMSDIKKGKPSDIDWGHEPKGTFEGDVARTVRIVIEDLGKRFAKECLGDQFLPTSKLVPVALAALESQDNPPVRRPRYLFIDEFQDTDGEQMDLLLALKEKLSSRLFVVGDTKQGIYRFRGAEGSAFTELKNRVKARKIDKLTEHRLNRNFRSGEVLLDSLHPYFEAWGKAELLEYTSKNRLRHNVKRTKASRELSKKIVAYGKNASEATKIVAAWRAQNPDASIAILCRRNWQAMEVQKEIRGANGSCDLMVGGDFFQTQAVKELRVLFEAVANPADNAALLELCETRWAYGILNQPAPRGLTRDQAKNWPIATVEIQGWESRLASLEKSNSIDTSDLDGLRKRIEILKMMLTQMSVQSWILECARAFSPSSCSLPQPDDDTERLRYSRCLDHLLMLIDAEFAESPTTLPRLLSWVRLQIATNSNEDEPVDAEDIKGKTTALTVHKSKGLEFDFVLIPYTVTSFDPSKNISSEVAIVRQRNGRPRVIWKWRGQEGPRTSPLTNVAPNEKLWEQEKDETACEEARLLYVAMTRARDELTIFIPKDSKKRTWSELLEMARI
jgi:superfamily I DNA/RNA helicase